MKASDLLKLIQERDDSGMGKVSYKNDHTPDNHVKNKKMKEVNPLPDKGEKHDNKPKANVGDVKKKEKRSMEGPATGAKAVESKLTEQPASAQQMQPSAGQQRKITRQVLFGDQEGRSAIQQFDDQNTTVVFKDYSDKDAQGRPVLMSLRLGPADYQKVKNAITRGEPSTQGMTAYKALMQSDRKQPHQRQRGHQGGVSVGKPMSPQQVAQAGAGWQLESVEAPGSMSAKQPVKSMGSVAKSTSVRKKQQDEPKPTANVGTPKKKEKRSMDENPVTVKDYKGGENEHKKMGVHEGINELEELLGRSLEVPFVEAHDVPTQHQINIAKKTLKMSDAGAKIMGGMTKEEARALLKKHGIKVKESHIDEVEIPKGQIEWLVNKIHVGTPDEEVAADFEKRMNKNMPELDEKTKKAVIAYALKVHKRNQDEYHKVMSGRL